MTRIASSSALAMVALAVSLPAHASPLTRTFVSSAGSDSNPCTVTAPCRTFAGAYANTAANGIIAALDPAGYGPFTITGAVTIDGNGWAAITAPNNGALMGRIGGNGLALTAPPPTTAAGIVVQAGSSDNVILRGLVIDGVGTGNNGIVFNSGGSLTVDGCVVRNTAGSGIVFNQTGSTTEMLAVSNSAFDGNSSGDGILIFPQSTGGVAASIDRTELNGNGNGLVVFAQLDMGAVTVGVSNSVAANNIALAFAVLSAGSFSNLTLTHSQTAGNGTGVDAFGANATIWLAQSTVTANTNGFNASSGGTINSFGDNYFAANGSNTGSLTPVGKQ